VFFVPGVRFCNIRSCFRCNNQASGHAARAPSA
jgi:hypothetical protein